MSFIVSLFKFQPPLLKGTLSVISSVFLFFKLFISFAVSFANVMCAFLVYEKILRQYSFARKLQRLAVIREKLRKTLLFKKFESKMLMKMTPVLLRLFVGWRRRTWSRSPSRRHRSSVSAASGSWRGSRLMRSCLCPLTKSGWIQKGFFLKFRKPIFIHILNSFSLPNGAKYLKLFIVFEFNKMLLKSPKAFESIQSVLSTLNYIVSSKGSQIFKVEYGN